eukprot:g5185.t1
MVKSQSRGNGSSKDEGAERYLPPIILGRMLIEKLKIETMGHSTSIKRSESVLKDVKPLFYRRTQLHMDNLNALATNDDDAIDHSLILSPTEAKKEARRSPFSSPRHDLLETLPPSQAVHAAPPASAIIADYLDLGNGDRPPVAHGGRTGALAQLPVPRAKWSLQDDTAALSPAERHERVEALHTEHLLQLIERERQREMVRQRNIRLTNSRAERERLATFYNEERALAREKILNSQEDTRRILDFSREHGGGLPQERPSVQVAADILAKHFSPMTRDEANIEKLRRKRRKQLIQSPQRAGKELGAVRQFRRKETMHTEHLMSAVRTEAALESKRRQQMRRLRKRGTKRERKRLLDVHKKQREKGRERIAALQETQQALLKSNTKKLKKQLRYERAKKIVANKPFRERARRELAEIVRGAKLKTFCKAVVSSAYCEGQSGFITAVRRRRRTRQEQKQRASRQYLARKVDAGRRQWWEACKTELQSIGVTKRRILDDTEFELTLTASRDSDDMLDGRAVDMELGPPLGVTTAKINSPLFLINFMKQHFNMEQVAGDFQACKDELGAVIDRLRLCHVPESKDSRRKRLEDPQHRMGKGLGYGLKARGIFRVKTSMGKRRRRYRRLKHVVVRTRLRSPQQVWKYECRKRQLFPANYGVGKTGGRISEVGINSGKAKTTKRPGREMRQREKAAIQIERIARGFLVRAKGHGADQSIVHTIGLSIVLDVASTEIQRIARGFLAKNKVKHLGGIKFRSSDSKIKN